MDPKEKPCESFSDQTTVHGLHIMGKPKLHFVERVFWLCVVLVAFGGAMAICYSNWMRYLANPTMVSIQKDFRNWENPFPAVTGCFFNKAETEKSEQFILSKWGINSSDPSYDYYLEFINIVANISYQNLHQFEKFKNDDSLKTINMFEIAQKVHPLLSGTLVTFDTKNKSKWTLIMTELGICFSMNSKFANLLAVQATDAELKQEHILRCHYLNGLCYARYDSDPKLPLQYYVHSSFDVVHATNVPALNLRESEELEINYRMQETDSSLALRSLYPSQRKCRFQNEPLTKDIPVYSTSMCYILCRYKLTLKYCGCRPFFYHHLGGKLCDISGLLCLAKHAQNLTKPPSQLGCKCPEPCDLIIYFAQVPKYTKWEYGYFDQRITFRWGLLHPTTKFHRDVLFGFEDLVVSFGGTLALFLGISFISAIETLYLIIENFYYSYNNRKRVAKVTFFRSYDN